MSRASALSTRAEQKKRTATYSSATRRHIHVKKGRFFQVVAGLVYVSCFETDACFHDAGWRVLAVFTWTCGQGCRVMCVCISGVL